MFRTDKRYLSISLNEATIKVAQVTSSGTVEKIARASVGGAASSDDLAKALKSILNGFDRRAPVVCVIPANAATSKNIEVPSSDPQEIMSIINLQASRHTPYSREEVLIGHINLGVGSGSNTKVLLVIAHRNVVKDRLAVLQKCGLSMDKALFIPEGIGRLYARGLNIKKDGPPLGVIDFSINFVNFLIVAKGGVIFSRCIPMGIKHLVEQADAQVKVCEEISKSLEAYQSEDIEPVPVSFVVTTDNEVVKQILPVLSETLKGEVRISSYLSLVKANAVKSKLQKEFADDSFLDVIAPFTCCPKPDVNLMPEEMLMKRTVEQQSKEAAVACIAAVIIMVLVIATLWSKVLFKETFLNKNLRAQYAAQKEEVASLQERMAKSRVVREYLSGRMVSLDTLKELYRITPMEIYLTGMVLEEDGTFTIAGVSQSLSQVFSYVKALDDSPMFKNAKTKSTATKKEGIKDVAVFEVVLKLDDGRKEANKQESK